MLTKTGLHFIYFNTVFLTCFRYFFLCQITNFKTNTCNCAITDQRVVCVRKLLRLSEI